MAFRVPHATILYDIPRTARTEFIRNLLRLALIAAHADHLSRAAFAQLQESHHLTLN
jgi:hypothetical protein